MERPHVDVNIEGKSPDVGWMFRADAGLSLKFVAVPHFEGKITQPQTIQKVWVFWAYRDTWFEEPNQSASEFRLRNLQVSR